MSDHCESGASNEMPIATNTGTPPTTSTTTTPSDAAAAAGGTGNSNNGTMTTTTVVPPTTVVTTTTTSQTNDFEVTVTHNGHLSPTTADGLINGNGAAGDTAATSSLTPPQPGQNFVTHHMPVHGAGSGGSGSHGNQGHFHGQSSSQRVNSPGTNLPRLSSNHRGHSPHRYSPNAPHSRGNSPHNHNTPPGQQHVVHVHVNPGETFSVRVGDQIQHIQGKNIHLQQQIYVCFNNICV